MSSAVTASQLRTHWADASNYRTGWGGRAQLAASFLHPGEKTVMDIGCGALLTLRDALPRDVAYLAADMKQWSPDVIVCDLNSGNLPVEKMTSCDVVFLLGVLEYVYDVPAVLAGLSQTAKVLIFSYCSTDDRKPRQPMWVNDYSGADILKAATEAGFILEQAAAYKPGQYVFRMSGIVPSASRRP